MWQKLIAFLERIQNAWLSVDNVSLRVLLELAMVLVVSYVSFLICQLCYLAIRRRILKRKPEGLPKLIFSSHAIDRALQVMPAGLLATRAISTLWLSATILMLTHIYFIFICANVFAAAMSLIYRISNWRRGVTASPQKGIFQVLALLGYLFAAVGIVATLSGRDPTYVLSGMTALSAVLMLVFKDSILGLTAGITLASNGMVRIRDWIEVPGTGADGEVIDIALTTVRVQNWDNTITTVPAYDLIAKPFKNWRGMSESGGRRIKRAILIDLDSICPAPTVRTTRRSSAGRRLTSCATTSPPRFERFTPTTPRTPPRPLPWSTPASSPTSAPSAPTAWPTCARIPTSTRASPSLSASSTPPIAAFPSKSTASAATPHGPTTRAFRVTSSTISWPLCPSSA